MQLIKPDINLDLVGKRKIAVLLSVLMLLVGFVSLVMQGGPNYGIDFEGGILVQVQIDADADAASIKDALKEMDLGGLVVQSFGDEANEFLIRAQSVVENGPENGRKSQLSDPGKLVLDNLQKAFGEDKVELRRNEMVGPQVGKDLREKGIMAVVYAMIGILLYITWRFEFRFAVGAIIALLHDVGITLGAFSLFGKEIDLPIIAAFLAIIGYSLNDTIIVYDRIRENMGKLSKSPFPVIVNRSINETLSRTILTSGTTLLVVAALFALGGGVIHNFAFALLIGVLIGTYSSIFVASPLLIFWDDYKAAKRKKA